MLLIFFKAHAGTGPAAGMVEKPLDIFSVSAIQERSAQDLFRSIKTDYDAVRFRDMYDFLICT